MWQRRKEYKMSFCYVEMGISHTARLHVGVVKIYDTYMKRKAGHPKTKKDLP